ncbi:Uncharacterized protein C17H9.06c [Hypsizygus marmoreus]|uniref:Uncharacterized protein C17H9.06c n=1 Tax=Hypsizygus marmoreus TaxID=39966 RepID=A0A369JHN9_HYPMA|nr:Uncharacterized protein C17H9.06c [Hypsizygus marmoreus]
MPPKTKNQSKLLRQTTLLGPTQTNRPSSSKSSPIATKRKRSTRSAMLRTHISDDDDDDAGLGAIKLQPQETHVVSSDSESEDLSHPAKKSRLRRGTQMRESEDDRHRTRRKRLTKGKKRVVASSSDDDEDLADEVEKERIIDTRLRARDKKTVFQKNLERLKRRKQGKPSESPSSGDEDDDDEPEHQDIPFKSAKPSSDFDSLFDEDSDASHSSDFIVEDDGTMAAPLPMQFSMESHQDLDYQFKKIFQFFVHIAVRPAKERREYMKEQFRKEEYFSVPLQTARRKISGLRDSLVASSVWRPDFKKPLETYPEFDLIPLDFAVPACDACHLGGRISTLIGRLSGLPYEKWGFEIKERHHSDSDDTSDGDSESSESDDSEKEPKVVEFHLGRFCAKRTRVYHEFTHWEYSLFKCIRDEVDELHASKQSGGFFRIAYAGGKKPPDDLDDADGICEWLDERKVIDMEWKKIQDMMESARHLDLASKRGDGDSD